MKEIRKKEHPGKKEDQGKRGPEKEAYYGPYSVIDASYSGIVAVAYVAGMMKRGGVHKCDGKQYMIEKGEVHGIKGTPKSASTWKAVLERLVDCTRFRMRRKPWDKEERRGIRSRRAERPGWGLVKGTVC